MGRHHEFMNKVVVITGGGSGIGRALAGETARLGANVIIADRDGETMTSVASDILRSGDKCEYSILDVAEADAVQALIDDVVARYGRIDYMINNAGVGVAGEVRDLALADWQDVLKVNLLGVIHGVVAVYPKMIAQGHGHIVITSSLAGLTPFPGSTPYAVSKFGLVGLATSLRAEAAALGVRVSVVCPGPVSTNMIKSTRFVNVDRERALSSFAIKPIAADVCARTILNGVVRNRSIIKVTPFAHLLDALYRIAPDIVIALAGRAFKGFRNARIDAMSPVQDTATTRERRAAPPPGGSHG